MSTLANLVVKMACDTSALERGLKGAKGSMNKLTSIVKTGALAGGAALAGLGVASVKLGLDFEKSMAEVKTLLPDISEKAFGKMKDDVLAFSAEMGIATDKAVPALYQAISAGVPKENVMEFMEVAAKAAVGGVTELETAVDGITSVVNAYGSEVLSAQKASDLMFTAVRLGKTDFNQLSNSLFNVVPTAASLGVGLDEIAASLAVMTAQGVPTSVATTSLRQAFVEASKGGTKLDKAIKALSGGQGLGALVAEGETASSVFEALRQSMPEQDFKDLFGSVEAMNAVLQITGPNADKMADALAEMGASSGATDKAFDTMAATASFKLNKAFNQIKVEMTKIGVKVLPLLIQGFEKASEIIQKKMVPFIKENLKPLLVALIPVIAALTAALWSMAAPIIVAAAPVIAVVAAFAALGAALFFIEQKTGFFTKAWEVAVDIFKRDVKPTLEDLGGLLKGLLSEALETVTNLWENLRPPLEELWQLIQANVLPVFEKVGQYLRDHKPLLVALAAVVLALVAPWLAVAAAIVVVLAKWDEISQFFTKDVPAAIDRFLDKIGEIPIIGEIFEGAFKAVKVIVETYFGMVKNYIETVINAIRDIIAIVTALIKGDWEGTWQGIKDLVSGIWDGIYAQIELTLGLIKDLLGVYAETFLGVIKDGWKLIQDHLLTNAYQLGRNIPTRLWEGIKAMKNWFLDQLGGFVDDIIDLINPLNWDLRGLSPLPHAYEKAGRLAAAAFGKGLSDIDVSAFTPSYAPTLAAPVSAAGVSGGSQTIIRQEIHFDGPVLGDHRQAEEFARYLMPIIRREHG